MKQKILLLTILIVSLCGCNKAPKYAIDGSLSEDLLQYVPAGTELGIYNRSQKEWIKLDSAVVAEDGTFHFEGTVEQPSISYINTNEGNLAQFVLEAGNINVNIGTESLEVTGTELNELLSDFNNKMESIESESEAIEYISSFLGDNINNVVGYTLFADYYSLLEIDVIDRIIPLMNEQTKAQPDVEKALTRIDILRQTSKGQPYIDINLSTPDGGQLALSQLVGKTDYVLVDFWSSWCGPCRRAMPAMIELYDQFNPNGQLEILGVSLDSDTAAWLGAIESLGLKWQHISDLQGWQSAGAKSYGVFSIPSTVLIDKNGVIVARNLEPNEYANLINDKK